MVVAEFEEVVLESPGCCAVVDDVLVTVFAGMTDRVDGVAGSFSVKIEADASGMFVDVKLSKGVVGGEGGRPTEGAILSVGGL